MSHVRNAGIFPMPYACAGSRHLAVIGLMALGAAWMPGNRFIVRSLQELNQGAGQRAGGNLAAQIPVRGSDELSELASSFNSMSSALIRQHELTDAARYA